MTADLVFTGGAVYTVDAARRWAQAVAIRDGRIAAVGTDADMRPFVGSKTEVVNLGGRLMLPGIQDAHIHPISGGIEMMRCNLADASTADAYASIIARYARDHPGAEWILGGGWSMEAFPRGTPAAAALDAIVPDRPVFLPNRDHHSAWVNTRALELAGIDASTPDPADGRIERDAAGAPTGALHEGAMELVGKHVPALTAGDLLDGLRVAQDYLHSLGITAWQDAAVAAPELRAAGTDQAYATFAGRGELTARVVGALWWDRHRGEEQLADLITLRDTATVGNFRATSVKIMQDGVCETFTAAVLEPYLDAHGRPTGNRGISFIEPQALRRYVTMLDAAGFQVHIHALAERAVREALDAIEAARAANGPSDHRHHLAHLQVIHPDDRPRLRELGVVANFQPLWACNEPQMTELTIPFLGPERSRWQYPIGELERLGTSLAFGSDWPVSTPNPLAEMHVAVNRVDPAEPGEPFLPDERVTLATAIHAFTMGSAYVNHLDTQTGSIEAGKLADLTVVDQDLFAAGAEHIADARVLLTLVGGTPVYDRW
jgi:predicted amidohydrolase YtcJ